MENDVLTPEQYAMLVQLGQQSGQAQSEMEQQKAMADLLRRQEFAPMRGNGRVQVAAHPLEALGNVMSNSRAQQIDMENMGRQRQIGDARGQQNRMIMEAILRGRQGGMGAGPAAPPDPYGALRQPGGYA